MGIRIAAIEDVQMEVDTHSLFNLKFQFPNPNAQINSKFQFQMTQTILFDV